MKPRVMAAALAAVTWCASVALAQPPGMGGAMQGGTMPDAKQMSGVPLASGDMAPGSVTVRVVRGSMANPLVGQTVQLVVNGGAPISKQTSDTGRAEFTSLTPGTRVTAIATVNGERLVSQEFDVPPAGGIRVALVATDPDMQKRAEEDKKLAQAPAQPGIVVLGDQSRFVFEIGEDGLNVFNLLEIVNTARTPVQPQGGPIVFDLPDAAVQPGLLEASTKQAVLAGKRITVTGPFAPGSTVLQFAYTVPFGSRDVTVEQRLPIALNQLSVMAQKVGELHLLSPQMADHREMNADGQSYIVGQGPALKAGDTVTFNFTGLPAESHWPLNIALALAVAILIAGLVATMRGGSATAAEQARVRKLQARRDKLFGELTALEERYRARTIDPERYARDRRDLVAALERVYAEMDEEAAA